MSLGEICTREFVTARREEPLTTAAQLMIDEHVGMVLVVEDHGGPIFPVGVLTDRDLVRALVKRGGAFDSLRVGDVMTRDPVVLREDEPVPEAVDRLRSNAVRRAPVIDEHGVLVGVVSVDDLLGWLASQLGHLAHFVQQQPALERH
jgi:CBS domain-containing protein